MHPFLCLHASLKVLQPVPNFVEVFCAIIFKGYFVFKIFSVLKFSTKSVKSGYHVSELTLINVEFCKYINIRQ